jgi:ribonuclease P protein component
LRSSDFRRVYDEGDRVTGPHFTLFFRKRADGGVRIGFTVPRALGRAVKRNRIRRRVREAFRPLLAGLNLPADLVVNPRGSALDAPFAELCKEAQRMLARCAN